jgi:membrane protease YdiL (CAAX protease family)
MPAPRASLRSLVRFTGLALGLSGVYWMAAVWQGSAFNRDLWGAVRGFIPAGAALLTVWWEGNRSPLPSIGIRPGRPEGSGWLYLLAFVGPMAVVGLAILAAGLWGPADWRLGEVQPGRFLLFFFAMALLDGPLGEELGWRGYLLPTLLRQVRPVVASVIVGAVWWLWHLPLYAADGRTLSPGFLGTYLVQLIAAATIYTWFFLRSRGSVLLAILLHQASNYSQFLASRLFPGMTQGETVDRFYVLGIAALGVAAALNIRGSGWAAHEPQEATAQVEGHTE